MLVPLSKASCKCATSIIWAKGKTAHPCVGKDALKIFDGTSYGIPIGPPASRLLAEAVLIDVDSTLLSFGFDFIRFVDDYIFFTDKVQDAEYCIRVLGETLFLNHGLTLQTSKTKISTASEYVQKHLVIHSDREKNRRQLLQLIQQDDYEITSYDDLDEENKTAIDAFNLAEMLHEALGENENVNYREVQFILGRLSALQKPELIPIVLENLDRLFYFIISSRMTVGRPSLSAVTYNDAVRFLQSSFEKQAASDYVIGGAVWDSSTSTKKSKTTTNLPLTPSIMIVKVKRRAASP